MTPLERLYARAPMGMRLGLAPMQQACEAEDHPERALHAVHIAGTNGKGSVAAMVESIGRGAGLRTGMYTSPHLCRFAERIRIDGEPIDDDTLARHLERALAHEGLSFFETATLAAFLALREARVELAVIEVGLGGRLDATNVINRPAAAAITRIALDHQQMLGDTLEAIAREKAGIAKPGLDIVLGPMSAEVRAAIDEAAKARGATTTAASDDPEASRFIRDAAVGLAGVHQRDNAAVAFVLARRAGCSELSCEQGIASVRWPGRLERIEDVLLDAAHNQDGAEALVRFLASTSKPEETALIFGALADKAWPEMIDVLAPCASRRFYVEPSARFGARATADPSAIAARHAGEACRSAAEALEHARATGAHLIVACGSMFLVGELRALLLGLPRDPPVAL